MMAEGAEQASKQDRKYDRQLRLWGARGQRALMESHTLLVHAGPTGTELLKNLVLPGVGCVCLCGVYVSGSRDWGRGGNGREGRTEGPCCHPCTPTGAHTHPQPQTQPPHRRFTILDDAHVGPRDLANNFFVTQQHVGQPRAEVGVCFALVGLGWLDGRIDSHTHIAGPN